MHARGSLLLTSIVRLHGGGSSRANLTAVRALFVSNLFPPHSLGGYEYACADVARRWRLAGHDVTVLTSDLRRTGVDGVDPPETRRVLPMTHLHGEVRPLWRRPPVERRARQVVDAVLQELRPDVVLVWNVAGLPFGAVRRLHERGVPTVFVVSDTWPGMVAAADPWIAPFRAGGLRSLVGSLAARVTGVATAVPRWSSLGTWVFVSESLLQQLRDATGDDFAGARIVPLGIDLGDFPIVGDRPPRPWRWHLLFVGRLDPTKGIDTLLRALPLLPAEATLEVCAPIEPVHLTRVEQLIGSLGLGGRVDVHAVERRHLRDRYRAADACVFPSEWDEPFGLVPLESMACATPVVASGTGGSGEFLEDGRNCLLAAPGRPEEIAGALHRLAAEPDLRARLTAGGRATASTFTADALADALADVAAGVLADR